MEILIFLGILWAIFGAFGGWIAVQKHRSPAEGAMLGVLFGPLGCLVEALLPAPARRPARGRGRDRVAWMPDYDERWDQPREPRPGDAVEDQVLDYLSGELGGRRESIDVDAIARAAREDEQRAKESYRRKG